MTSSNEKNTSSQRLSIELILVTTGEGEFYNNNSLLAPREEICDGKNIWDDVNNTKQKELVAYLDVPDRRIILHA